MIIILFFMSEKSSDNHEIVLDFYKEGDEELDSAGQLDDRPLSKFGSKNSGRAFANEINKLDVKKKNKYSASSENLLN